MKILRVTPHYYLNASKWPALLDPMGGMHVQTAGMSEWLNKTKQTEHTVLTSGLPNLPAIMNKNGIKIINTKFMNLPSRSNKLLGFSWMIGTIIWLLRNFRRARKDFDLVHIHSSAVAAPLLITILTKFLLQKKLVLTIHRGRISTFTGENSLANLFNGIVGAIEKLAMKSADHIVFLTQSAFECYNELLPLKNKSSVLGDAFYDHTLVSDHNLPQDIETFLSTNDPVVLYVGRVSWEKGWDCFLKIAGKIAEESPARFLMCGDGPYGKSVAELAADLKITERLLFTGFVPKEIIGTIMAKSTLLIVPSRHEEFGGVIIEAGVSNLPVIASKTNGPKKLLVHGQTGYLADIDDVDDFVQLSLAILEDRRESNHCAEKLSRYVRENYSSDFVNEAIYAIYQKLTGQASAKDLL